MQVSFNGHPYLFVNQVYKGKYISPAEAAGRWINYGGDKIWPLPEGNDDEQHWTELPRLLTTAHMPSRFCHKTIAARCGWRARRTRLRAFNTRVR